MSVRSSVYRLWNLMMPWLPAQATEEARRSIGIIMVHDVLEDAVAPRLATSTSVPFSSFQANVLGLTRNFSFISLDEAVDMLRGKCPWRSHCLVLTFDDSLKCLAQVVAPRLREWGIPATFYLSTEAIDRQQPYWWHRLDYAISRGRGQKVPLSLPSGQALELELSPGSSTARQLAGTLRRSSPAVCEQTVMEVEALSGLSLGLSSEEVALGQVMTWEDVRTLVRSGMSLGCHTQTHANLLWVPPEALDEELTQARQLIAAKGGAECHHFCYPYGAHSELVCAAVKAAGFRSAVTTLRPGWNRPGEDLFRLQRFHMHEEPYCLPCIMSGLGQLMTRVKDSCRTRN